MKMKKHGLLVVGMLLLLTRSYGQSIDGPTTVTQNVQATYTFNSGVIYGNQRWETDGAMNVSSSLSGTLYTYNVTWGSTGTYTLAFLNNNTAVATLNVTVVAPPACTTPANPSGLTFTPSSNTCGSKTITYSGTTPPSGVTWYWQTSSSGTDVTNATTTVTAAASGTYYVRAKANSGSCWSTGTASTSVTVNVLPAVPTSPTVSTNTCGAKTLTRVSPPTGVTWYWQGTDPNGTDVSGTASASTYSASTSGTYYLRARDNTSLCWSTAASKAVTVNDPAAPNASTYQYCEFETLAMTTSGYPANGSLRWYDATGTTLLFTGITYTPSVAAGSYTYRVKSYSSQNCESPGYAQVTLTVVANCDEKINWSQSTGYTVVNGTEQVANASKQYSDGFGKSLQSQAKNITANQVLAAQPLYDRLGNASASTLTAPINSTDFVYKHSFVTNASGQHYGANDFDQPISAGASGEVNNPKPVANGGIGTLGWYYSSSNTLEPLTPTTTFPYSRSYTPEGPNPTTSKSAMAGDEYRMGNTHETSTERQKIAVGELDHYFKLRAYFVNTPSPYVTNLLSNVSFATTANFTANQNVTVSAANNVITATCNQTTSTPGITPIGGLISVTAGKTYRFMVKGYKNSATYPAKLYVGPSSGTNIVWPGPLLPTDGAASEAWVGVTFTVPAGVTSIKVGVLWYPAAIGDQFYLSAVDLRPELPSTSIGYKLIATDADGKKTVTFTDISGNTLATATLTGSTYDYWSYTYYNDLGQVVATVAPQGVVTSSTSYPQFVTTYKYDHFGRLIETTSTDEGTSQFVYSLDGKIRFSQNQEQRTATPQRFSYTNYDYLGRLIESGEYSTSGTGYYVFETNSVTTPAGTSVLGIADNIGFTGITIKSDPNNRCSDYTLIEYDQQATDFVTDTDHPSQKNLNGQISKTRTANARTWYSYDEFGQLEWSKQKLDTLGFKTVDYVYDYAGNVRDVIYQKGKTDAFYHHYYYDADQRLIQVKTSTDGVASHKVNRAKYYYYLHGPLKRLELLDSLTKVQGIDYVYTINGGLKGINHGAQERDPGQDGITGSPNASFTKDAFGETMHYHDSDYSGGYGPGTISLNSTTYPNMYSGNLRAIAYNNSTDLNVGATANSARVYAYQYDAINQLTNAQWGTITGTYPSYDDNLVENNRENITGYDKNGNIQSLVRKNRSGSVSANYGYVYETNTNKLDKINHNSAQLVDYTYNNIGQMTKQDEGTGKVYNVKYNAYGLVKEVSDASSQLLLRYVYDDRGDLVNKISYNAGTAAKSTFYVRDVSGNVMAIYQQTLPSGTMQQVEVPVYASGRIGTYKPQVSTCFYEVSDHLGNVRAVIGLPKTNAYAATMETENAATEEPPFKNIANTRVNYLNANHTPNSTGVTGNEVAKLNNAKPAGPSLSLAVSPGDVINMDVWDYYEAGSSNFSALLSEASMITAVASAFGGVSGGAGESGQIYTNVQNGFTTTFGSGSSTLPAAFLTWVVYDKNFTRLFYGSQGVTSSGNMAKEHLIAPAVKIEQPGYIYICVYNRSDNVNPVYFDDLTVSVQHSPIVAGADYYPFGLVMDGSEITDESYRYGYQGQYSEENETTGWNEFELRMYDARFGRWLSPDPNAQFASPYVAFGNSPTLNVDRTGGVTWPVAQGVNLARVAAGPTSTIVNGVVMTMIEEVTVTASALNSLADKALWILEDFGDFMTSSRVLNEMDRHFNGMTTKVASFNYGATGWNAGWKGEYDDVIVKLGLGVSVMSNFYSGGEGGISPNVKPVLETPNGLLSVASPRVVPMVKILDDNGRILANETPENTQWGWTGSQLWRELVKKVSGGGTLTNLNGKIPTKAEAIRLIQEGGGTIDRIEAGHAPPNPHQYNHINYTTSSGLKGTIQIINL